MYRAARFARSLRPAPKAESTRRARFRCSSRRAAERRECDAERPESPAFGRGAGRVFLEFALAVVGPRAGANSPAKLDVVRKRVMESAAPVDLRAMIERTYELENRIRNLQSTIERLRVDFDRAVTDHHLELEEMLTHNDTYYGLPEQIVPMRASS